MNTAVHMTFGDIYYGCAQKSCCKRLTFWTCRWLLLLPIVYVQALDVTVSQSSVQVARGQAAILPCSFTTSAALNNLNIIWMVIPLSNANQPEQVLKKKHLRKKKKNKKSNKQIQLLGTELTFCAKSVFTSKFFCSLRDNSIRWHIPVPHSSISAWFCLQRNS